MKIVISGKCDKKIYGVHLSSLCEAISLSSSR